MKILKGPRRELEKRVALVLEYEIKILLKKQSYIVMGLVGGTSVSGIFKHLKERNIDWNKIHFFMIDERRVPITNKNSNFKLAKESFLNYLIKNKKMDKEHLHPYDYKKPLSVYTNELKAHGGKFDISILSSGEDAHVASLFPNYSIKNQDNYFTKFDNSPEPPKKRMSASRKLLEKSGVALLIFFGGGKREAYKKFRNKFLSVKKVPAKLVNKIQKVYVFTTN